jgi:hypothetical protein
MSGVVTGGNLSGGGRILLNNILGAKFDVLFDVFFGFLLRSD